MNYLTLNNGVQIPLLGFGTYEIVPAKTKAAVLTAFQAGYRLIDTAQYYRNEEQVGQAVRVSGLKREQVFITTKTMTSGYQETVAGIDQSLQKSGLNYFDLILIHWPMGDDLETWRALEKAYQDGKARAIGISNFNRRQTQALMAQGQVKPMVDQIETHLLLQQWKMHAFLQKAGIAHESYSPLGSGTQELLGNKTLQTIGQKYGKTPVQVALRFLVQNQIITIPRSTTPQHIQSNFAIFDFSLTDADLAQIRALDQRQPIDGWPEAMQEDEDY